MAEYIEREVAIEAIMSEPPDAHYPQWYAEKIKSIPAPTLRRCRSGSASRIGFQEMVSLSSWLQVESVGILRL